jgi:hypothetical protein
VRSWLQPIPRLSRPRKPDQKTGSQTNLHKEMAFPAANLSRDSEESNHSSDLPVRCTAARFLMKL